MVASVLEFPDPKTIWRLDFTIPVDGPVTIKKLDSWEMKIERGYGTAFIPGASKKVATRKLLEALPDAKLVVGKQ